MRRYRKSANPFYFLLVIAGLSFALTATAYVVMAFREAQPLEARADDQLAASRESSSIVTRDHPLMIFMRRHGEVALLTELGLLAICTFAAISTDSYWQRRADVGRSQST